MNELYPELSDEDIQKEIDRLKEVLKKPQLTARNSYALLNLEELQRQRKLSKQEKTILKKAGGHAAMASAKKLVEKGSG